MSRIYRKNCDNCKNYYEGKGKYFCSNRCSALSRHSVFKMIGINHPRYKNGLPKCLDCKKSLSDYNNRRCKDCYVKFKCGINSPNWRGGWINKFKCLDCSKKLSYGSKRCENCYFKFNVGENNHSYKDGRTPLCEKIRKCEKYITLMKESKDRDFYQCLIPNCGKIGGNLESNHIKLFSRILEENNIKTLEDAYSCPELWDPKNLITLCKPCHKSIRGREEEFTNLFTSILNKLYYEV